jgi:hypothetical protein
MEVNLDVLDTSDGSDRRDVGARGASCCDTSVEAGNTLSTAGIQSTKEKVLGQHRG